jgi:hypothetical protein
LIPRGLPTIAKQNGARIVEINPEQAFPDADYYFGEKSGVAMPEILKAIK